MIADIFGTNISVKRTRPEIEDQQPTFSFPQATDAQVPDFFTSPDCSLRLATRAMSKSRGLKIPSFYKNYFDCLNTTTNDTETVLSRNTFEKTISGRLGADFNNAVSTRYDRYLDNEQSSLVSGTQENAEVGTTDKGCINETSQEETGNTSSRVSTVSGYRVSRKSLILLFGQRIQYRPSYSEYRNFYCNVWKLKDVQLNLFVL